MTLVFVGDRCADHSPSSGYDQLCALFPEAGWLSGRALAAGDLHWIRCPPVAADLSRALFHVIYGDCSGRALPAILRGRWPQGSVVASVHQPVSRLRCDEAALRALHEVDAIITVCRDQARLLPGLGLPASLHVVPHGVWTSAFPPGLHEQGPDAAVLVVGSYLRDWPLTRRVVGALARAGVRSVLVGAAARNVGIDHPLVQPSPRLTEAELARHYQRSAALLLAVEDATASNALLEAMAAGCPVVCGRFPALVEYLGDDADTFPPGDPAAAVQRVLRCVTDPQRRSARSRALTRRAQQFDWARLRPRYAHTYDQIRTRTRQVYGDV